MRASSRSDEATCDKEVAQGINESPEKRTMRAEATMTIAKSPGVPLIVLFPFLSFSFFSFPFLFFFLSFFFLFSFFFLSFFFLFFFFF